MLLDSAAQTLYLFGGWDGYKDLNDFWSYDVAASRWRLISADTEADGGPSPRFSIFFLPAAQLPR